MANGTRFTVGFSEEYEGETSYSWWSDEGHQIITAPPSIISYVGAAYGEIIDYDTHHISGAEVDTCTLYWGDDDPPPEVKSAGPVEPPLTGVLALLTYTPSSQPDGGTVYYIKFETTGPSSSANSSFVLGVPAKPTSPTPSDAAADVLLGLSLLEWEAG
jgi:hypothetical protein